MGKSDPDRPSETGGLPHLALTHGQTIWLMKELGLQHGATTSTFNYYIKSLRKLGIPFEVGKGQSEGRRHVTYNSEELMELAIALLLRVYGTLPDIVVAGLRNFREDLRPIYREAFREAMTRRIPAVKISERQGRHDAVKGLFLDLNIRYTAGQMIVFGPPAVLSPFEAIRAFAHSEMPGRSYLPLNVAAVAEMIIEHTRVLPGRRRRSNSEGVPRA
ncbi:MAG: hypothetical protein KGR71_12975 [Proteobacteria bacterium]|nr:hypothetical protein [Pseudomonadota bacterium]